MATLDWSQCPVVETAPGKVGGAWVLKGTRIPVSAVFENLEAGANIDELTQWFDGLHRTQVEAVIQWVNACRNTPFDPAFDERMTQADGIMARYRNTLHELAK